MKINRWMMAGVFIIVVVVSSGCAAREPKAFVPTNIEPIPPGKARIVLTRQPMVALIPLYVMADVGKNIDANGMLVALQGKNRRPFAEKDYLDLNKHVHSVRFLWFNPNKMRSVFCGNSYRKTTPLKEKYRFRSGFVLGQLNLYWRTGAVFGFEGVSRKFYTITDQENFRRVKGDLWADKMMLNVDAWEPITKFPHHEAIKYLRKIWYGGDFLTLMEQVRTNKLNQTYLNESITPHFRSMEKVSPKSIQSFALEKHGIKAVLSRGIDSIDNRKIFRNVRVLEQMDFGDTLIWDRNPGEMRLIAVHAGFDGDAAEMMPMVVEVEAGRTYYVEFIRTIREMRWVLRKIE